MDPILIPELELDIIPTNNNDLRIELMNEDFIDYLKNNNLLTTDLDTGIVYIKIRELTAFIEHLQKMYVTYKQDKN